MYAHLVIKMVNLVISQSLSKDHEQRQRERHLKTWLHIFEVISQLFCHFARNMCLTILELNWTSASEIRKQHHMVTSSRQPQIRSFHENEKVYEMCKNEKCTCKACKFFFFLLSGMQIYEVHVDLVVGVPFSSLLFCRECHGLVHKCVLLAYFSPLDQ